MWTENLSLFASSLYQTKVIFQKNVTPDAGADNITVPLVFENNARPFQRQTRGSHGTKEKRLVTNRILIREKKSSIRNKVVL